LKDSFLDVFRGRFLEKVFMNVDNTFRLAQNFESSL
jgi:hypothetical protein